MPTRKYLKTPESIDDVVIWKEEGQVEGEDFFDYRIHAIGVEKFIPTDWTVGEKLFDNPHVKVDVNLLRCDDTLWFEYNDGHNGISHVLEGNTSGLKIGGAHAPQFLKFLGYEVDLLENYSNGVFKANLKKGDAVKERNHTMYPKNWGWDMTLNHFYEALIRAKYLEKNIFEGEYQLEGEENVKIHIGFSMQDKTFRVTTFFPIKPE